MNPLETYTIPFSEYAKLSKEEVKELYKKYRILGIHQIIHDTGDLLLIPKGHLISENSTKKL